MARLAALLADSTRAGFCLALLDGRAWTAGELAAQAKVAASTATEHLNRLVEGGLVVERRQGRHRYVQLASHRVAAMLEDFVAFLGPVDERGNTLKVATASAALARGRTCYDHLAGRLGVAITDAMTGRGLIEARDGFALTKAGMDWLTGPLAVDPGRLRATRRPLAKACLDWTERRSHLAGASGAQIHRRFRENGWIRRSGTGRAVRLTPAGAVALRDLLGIEDDTLLT
ncbi:winged helix-turn-helix domain-containing protein [Amycolatopsis minnesotensis]|uniref:Winged helix-turn-helix domain-containing protein n=1 Tax=Amycolatopsis minnesotensis TaxID=337894 RepID=A0ABP5CBH4_9PSEU